MALITTTAPMSNLTCYRKDFTNKSAQRPIKATEVPEYNNPIIGPMKEHILPNFKYKNLSPSQTKLYPDPKQFAEHLVENYPSTRVCLRDPPGGPLDLDVIDDLYKDENRSTYMVSYCKAGDYESKMSIRNKKLSFPEGWVVHLTTHRCSYRPPYILTPEKRQEVLKFYPKDNLIPNEKEREILNIKTGESIYISDISNTGMEIIKGKLHGDVNIRPKFKEEDLLKAKLIRNIVPII